MSAELVREIQNRKQSARAVIVAHYYQPHAIQEIADFVGDSLELAQKAAATEADVVVFCGVRFMAESAAIISPEKQVYLAAEGAGCELADMADPVALGALKARHPEAAVVCYVNSSAEVKAESDICCTSANALQVVESLGEEEAIFVPDGNLAQFVAAKSSKRIIPWGGYCPIHHELSSDDVGRMRLMYPDALIAVHPECRPEVTQLADYVGSTSGIRRYVAAQKAQSYVIGTDTGILYTLQKENPAKLFYPLGEGLRCKDMKLTVLEDVLAALTGRREPVWVAPGVAGPARLAMRRMLDLRR